jgi:hypothetical protein
MDEGTSSIAEHSEDAQQHPDHTVGSELDAEVCGGPGVGVLGILPGDAAATVLGQLGPTSLLACAALSRTLRVMCNEALFALSILDLSVQLYASGAHGLFAAGSLERYDDFVAVGASALPKREPLCQDRLAALLRRMPNLSRMSLQGRLLVNHRESIQPQATQNCFGDSLAVAAGQIEHLDLSFAAVAAPAGWGAYLPPHLRTLNARGFQTSELHLMLAGLAHAPLLYAVDFEGSGHFLAGRAVNPYDIIRGIAEGGQLRGLPPASSTGAACKDGDFDTKGCRRVRHLSLASCRSLRLLGCKALLHTVSANSSLTSLDVRNILASDEGDALFKGLALGAPCLRALAVSSLRISPAAMSLFADRLRHTISTVHLARCQVAPAAVGLLLSTARITALCVSLDPCAWRGADAMAAAAGDEGEGLEAAGVEEREQVQLRWSRALMLQSEPLSGMRHTDTDTHARTHARTRKCSRASPCLA